MALSARHPLCHEREQLLHADGADSRHPHCADQYPESTGTHQQQSEQCVPHKVSALRGQLRLGAPPAGDLLYAIYERR